MNLNCFPSPPAELRVMPHRALARKGSLTSHPGYVAMGTELGAERVLGRGWPMSFGVWSQRLIGSWLWLGTSGRQEALWGYLWSWGQQETLQEECPICLDFGKTEVQTFSWACWLLCVKQQVQRTLERTVPERFACGGMVSPTKKLRECSLGASLRWVV